MRPDFSPKQNHAIDNSNSTINIWEGSVRSGKSYSCLYRFIKELDEGPQGLYLICGKSERTIHNNIIAELDKMTGYCIRYNKVEASFTLWGKKVICVGANDERAVGKIQGVTLAGALVDEITILPENFFDMLVSRLSIAGAKLFGTCNPDSPYHWLKERFIDKAGQGLVSVFTFNLSDNPSLPATYVENLKKAYSGLWYKRYIEGLWVLAEGSVYDFFDNYMHTVEKPHTYAKEYFLGVDYGTHNPFAAVMIGYNNERRPFLWVEKEFYYDPAARGRQQTDYEFLQWLHREFFEYYPIKSIYLDPSAQSFELELKRDRKPVIQANNDVLDGIRTVSKLIAQGDLVICKGCKNLIREIEGYCWDPKSIKLGEDTPLKKNDHLCVTGDTKIKTDKGEFEIKYLVDNQPKGNLINWNKDKELFEVDEYINANMTSENAEVWELELENGKKLKATPDHKIYCKRGLIAIQDLLPIDMVLCYN